MFAVIVKVRIKPENRSEFIEAMLADGRGSVQNEPDCLQRYRLQISPTYLR